MLAAAQVPVETSQPTLIGEMWQRTELYFGTSKPDGTVVTQLKNSKPD